MSLYGTRVLVVLMVWLLDAKGYGKKRIGAMVMVEWWMQGRSATGLGRE